VERVRVLHSLLLLSVGHDLERGHESRVGAAEDLPRIGDVVEVAVREQEEVEPIKGVGTYICERILRKERIDEDPRPVISQQLDTCVSMKDQLRHIRLAPISFQPARRPVDRFPLASSSP
jgi:hypothetical protein